ncbi:MAG: ferrous iron transport protein A [Candidatus Omnitrophica bacterium]|nr:ferrous iron transport protein A [Candidatus Omnitrophota bacterium]MCM8808961.1 ferrous iron transport protein A [Candidatus Omnitrophota bacterium]MCM8811325.1 ferrous iron transport protein A [Candidatus Omnitrophota bacterium]
MKSLAEVKEGKYRIIEVQKVGRQRLKKLSTLGIFIGDVIEVIKPGPGPVIIKKGNIRIGIGYGIAMSIIVDEIE